jgi:hypothetical protein
VLCALCVVCVIQLVRILIVLNSTMRPFRYLCGVNGTPITCFGLWCGVWCGGCVVVCGVVCGVCGVVCGVWWWCVVWGLAKTIHTPKGVGHQWEMVSIS